MTDTATDSPKLLTDAPASTDLLGFKPHAERLAALILRQIPAKASFVIGIEGEWGEGKSSFINLLKDAFPTDDTRPTIVDFNPWWFEGSDQLLRHFFDELLGQIDWTRGGGEKLFDSFSKLAAFAGRVGKLMQLAPEPMLQTAGKVAEGVGQAWGGGSKPESFRKLRDAAADTLAALSFKTIVFIDDLDRLPAREIVELFRVIKAVADLPNIVYVIAYDRAIVASALEGVHPGRGGDSYLEKIVQLPYRLPKPTQAQFFAYNTALLADFMSADASAAADQAEEQQALNLVVKAFLPLPRDAKRLLAALAVNYAVPIEIRMEKLDFLFLESMRLKNQPLWQAMLNACLDCERYATMKSLNAAMVARALGNETGLSERRQWLESHFDVVNIREPALLTVMHYFTGLPFTTEQDDKTRQQVVRGLSQFGEVERAEDLKELATSYLQRVLPETALSQVQITEFVMADTAEEIAACIQSCVFPSRLLQAGRDCLRIAFGSQEISLSKLKMHLTAVATYMDSHLDLSLVDAQGKYVRASWIFQGRFNDVEQYIRDGLFLAEPELHRKKTLVGEAEILFSSWLKPQVAPRTVADLVFSSGKGIYGGMKVDVIAYFVRLPLVDFLKTGVAGEMLEFMAGSEGQMDSYRKRWLENLPSPDNLSEQEKTLLGVLVKNWSQEVSQDWLTDATPFVSLVAAVQGSAIEQDKREACRQFVALAERRLSERRT